MMQPFYDISGPCKRSDFTEVKGTYYYSPTLRTMFVQEGAQERKEFFSLVTLVPEPDNPYSSSGHAISVRWNAQVISHIPSGISTEYRQIGRIAASGFTALTVARVWATTRSDGQRGYWVSVALPEPSLLYPINAAPSQAWTLLPGGSVSQVTKESDHRDVLSAYCPKTQENHILVTLHLMPPTEKRPWEGVEVRLDGNRIGELTQLTSGKYVSTVRHYSIQGVLSVSRATIDRAGEVKLFAATADLLRPEDLTLRPDLPELIPYEVDPSNYDVPPAYQENSSDKNKKATVQLPSNSGALLDSTPWAQLLEPDTSPRATPFQRGYTRSAISRSFPNTRVPRLDYASVGQCEKILHYFNQPVEKLHQGGRDSLRLWWLSIVFFLLTGLALSTVILGQIILLLIAGVSIHHFWTRTKLQPPFHQQK